MTINPQDMACFAKVADMIGEDNAELELQTVIDSLDGKIGLDEDDDGVVDYWLEENAVNTVAAFNWSTSPQGHAFWRNIHKGVNPYE